MWGWPLVAWGRLGKVFQFVAGLSVVLDLIGPDPLRAFGRRLWVVEWGKRFERTSEVIAAIVVAATLVGYIALLILSYFMEGLLPEVDISGTWLDTYYGALVMGISFVIVWITLGTVAEKMWKDAESPPRITGNALEDLENMKKDIAEGRKRINQAMSFGPIIMIGVLLALLILLPWAVFIYGICLPVSRGLAAVLDRSRPAHPLRWLAFSLFVIGFHFDLLAS
ncbi:MAG: hypothetical protein LC775_02190 [Acidobacteria bacterium]|nr:hypothetical protein [Acidobacteriota bacterium]